MRLSSPDFENEGEFPARYSCDGDGVSPALSIEDVPPDAGSLALTAEDPDAPSGTFTHWVVWNIEPSVSRFDRGGVPAGAVEGRNTAGRTGYFPPCPPENGAHRYFFHLYALDSKIDIPPSAESDDLKKAMDGRVVASASIMGRYKRG